MRNREAQPHLEKDAEGRYERLSAPMRDSEELVEKEDAMEAICSKIIESIMQQAGDYGRKTIFNNDDSRR